MTYNKERMLCDYTLNAEGSSMGGCWLNLLYNAGTSLKFCYTTPYEVRGWSEWAILRYIISPTVLRIFGFLRIWLREGIFRTPLISGTYCCESHATFRWTEVSSHVLPLNALIRHISANHMVYVPPVSWLICVCIGLLCEGVCEGECFYVNVHCC